MKCKCAKVWKLCYGLGAVANNTAIDFLNIQGYNLMGFFAKRLWHLVMMMMMMMMMMMILITIIIFLLLLLIYY
jgi:hypothetical protein